MTGSDSDQYVIDTVEQWCVVSVGYLISLHVSEDVQCSELVKLLITSTICIELFVVFGLNTMSVHNQLLSVAPVQVMEDSFLTT